MEPLGIIIGLAIGGGIGFAAAAMSKGKIQAQLDGLKKEQEKAGKALRAGEKKTKDAEKKAKELEDRLGKTKKSLKTVESEKKKKDQEAKSTAKALEKSKAQAQKAQSKASELEKTTDQLKEDLAAVGARPAAKFEDVGGDLNGILRVLCEHEEQEAAVLADSNGIVIAAFGNNDVKEGMAAAANRITKISDELKGIVDFNAVSAFRIGDVNEHVIAGRTVEIDGELVALATVGSTIPSDKSLDGAIENLSSALAG